MRPMTQKLLALAFAALAATGAYAEEPGTISDAQKAAEALSGSIVIKSQDAVAFVPVVEIDAQVPWRVAPVAVDGDVKEWASVAPTAVLGGDKFVTWTRGAYAGKDDLSTRVWLARDGDFLYLALEARDDKAPAPARVEVAIADAKSPLITTWRDVGKRYGADDVHLLFTPGAGGAAKVTWRHAPERLAVDAINSAFGTEEERREFVEQREDQSRHPKIFSSLVSRKEDDRQITAFEVAIPWRLLAPYDPVSYEPLKLNVAIEDSDGAAGGVMAWAPGIVGTYSAAHFPKLKFQRPDGQSSVECWGQLSAHHFVNQNIDFGLGFFNPTDQPIEGTLELYSKPGADDKPLLSVPVKLPAGYSRPKVQLHSEKVGQTSCSFVGRLKLAEGTTIIVPVHAPSLDDSITIMPLAVVEAEITKLEKNVQVLSDLYEQVKAKGLDTAYPLAYLTLQKMFIERCRGDLRGGDSQRVLDNCAHLARTFEAYKAYMERVLADPSTQLRVPPRFAPDKLVVKDGFYFDGDRPVFLWGPCLFWYMRKDQHYAWELGFNSVGPEVPVANEKARPEIEAYLNAFATNGMMVNASIGSAQFDEMKKAHPEVANVDGNNFLPIIIQHPLVRQEIRKRIETDIEFFKRFPAVRSYWLWNEPMYANYSEMTRRDFIEQYLKPRFKTIEALNERWGTDHKSFDEAQIQRNAGKNPAAWYDFQQFQGDLFADFFGFLHKTAHDADPTRPTHVKFMAFTLDYFDIGRLAALGGISGHDGNQSYRDIPFLDFSRSVFPDKPVTDTEIHLPWAQSFARRTPWLLALHGLADGNWWCWHSNARFSNSVGSAENMEAVTLAGLDIQRLYDPYIFALNRKPRRIVTLFPNPLPGRGGFVNSFRYDWSPAQNSLGIQPAYSTEDLIARGDLAKYDLLIAGDTGFALDATYQTVLQWVKDGGRVIVTPGSFKVDELNRPRDASELVKPDAGEAFTDRSRIYPVGRGQVILVDDNLPKAAKDDPRALTKVTLFRTVLAKAQQAFSLGDDVALDIDPADSKYSDFDWRSAKVAGGYALCLVPANWWNGDPVWWNQNVADTQLKTIRPVKRIVNLVTQTEIKPEQFKLEPGPNLFLIELEKE